MFLWEGIQTLLKDNKFAFLLLMLKSRKGQEYIGLLRSKVHEWIISVCKKLFEK